MYKEMDTKQTIIEIALKLFNNNGSHNVTTRHIAAEMGISPGNLYYHFRNKEEIIRILFERMIDEFNLFIRPTSYNSNLIDQFNDAVSHTGKVMYKYRFFFMELYTLLEKDSVLKKMYMKIKQERVSDFRSIYKFLEQAGLIEETLSDDDFSMINGNIWTLAEFLLQSMYMNGIKITHENIIRKFSQIIYMIRPYLKKEFRGLIK